MKKRYYMAYGSNMNQAQMAQRCPTAKIVGTTVIKGYRLRFNGVATIEPKNGGIVPVVVWELQERDERNLDIYEGYPRFYAKQEMAVELNGKRIKAMVYVMTPGRAEAEPTMGYYNAIAKGYKDAGINDRPLIEAYQRAHFGTEKASDSDRIMHWLNRLF